MSFDARCFWHAKDLASVADYEDAFDVDPNTGRAAIADGVSTAIFSRRWAQLLTSSSVASPPAWEDDAAVNAWILEQRKAWAKSINIQTLPWMQKAKLEQSGGAYAAFLWAEVLPLSGSGPDGSQGGGAQGGGVDNGFRCRSVAVGDCCLFHVRGGEVLGRFPLSCEADFARDPLTFCSSSRNRQPHPPLQRCAFECHAGDWIVLSSDALAKWLYRLSDAGQPIDWHSLWRQDAYVWTQRVGSLRLLNASERIRVDDTTLLILRVGQMPSASVVEASESAEPTVIVDESLAREPSLDSGSSESQSDVVVAELADDEHSVAPTAGSPVELACRDNSSGDGSSGDGSSGKSSTINESGDSAAPDGSDGSSEGASPATPDIPPASHSAENSPSADKPLGGASMSSASMSSASMSSASVSSASVSSASVSSASVSSESVSSESVTSETATLQTASGETLADEAVAPVAVAPVAVAPVAVAPVAVAPAASAPAAVAPAAVVAAQQDAGLETVALEVPQPAATAGGTSTSTSDPSTSEAARSGSSETADQDEPPGASVPELR
jgi:hypothetical protein